MCVILSTNLEKRGAEMEAVFWILMIILIIMFFCSLLDASNSKFSVEDRKYYLVLTVAVFVMMLTLWYIRTCLIRM